MQNASQYAKNGAFRLKQISEIYKEHLKLLDWPKLGNVKVMDIGCADGEVSTKVLFPLVPENCSEFVCTDVDPAMVNHCESLIVQPKISFQQLDITSEKIPNHLEGRFNFLFSSYCFTSVRNIRKALLNSYQLLKPNGELLFFFMYKKNHLLTTYKRLSQIKRWHPYTSEFSDFTPHFSSEDPEAEVKNLLVETGFELIAHEFRNNCYYGATAKCHLGIYLSVDTIFSRIPKDEKSQYSKDFRKILSEETGIDFVDENKLEDVAELHIPTVILSARKLK